MIGVTDSKFDDPYNNNTQSAPNVGTSSQGRGQGQQSAPDRVVVVHTPNVVDEYHPGGESGDYGGEQPPEFTFYEAQQWVDGDGNVISHDPHLNEDGEALYRFLLSQTTEPPKLSVRCRGTHREVRTRTVTHMGHTNSNGEHHGTHTKTETYTETVIDFDFRIDLSQHFLPAVNWTVSDNEPAYRGRMVREKEIQDGISLTRQKTRRKENKAAERWVKFKKESGYPPWMPLGSMDELQNLTREPRFHSSRTLRDWADEYCASDKLLKEFVFEKVAHGWNLGALRRSIETLIKSTYYTGDLIVTFPVSANKVYIRPTNRLSRALSHWWVKLLLWITLIYPFIWLFKRFSPIGGGQWKVAGAAYPLKEWVHCEDSVPGEDVVQYAARRQERLLQQQNQRAALLDLPAYSPQPTSVAVAATSSSLGDAWQDRQPNSLAQIGLPSPSTHVIPAIPGAVVPSISKFKQTPKGISELVGLREGEWFKQWESTLTRSVLMRVQRQDPIMIPTEVAAQSAGALLDGFND